MKLKRIIAVLIAFNALLVAIWLLRPHTLEQRARELREEKLEPRFERLKPLEKAWLDPDPQRHLRRGREPGSTFAEYRSWDPTRPAPGRSSVDLQPLGDFSPEQRKLITLSADFLRRISTLEVRVHDPLPLFPDLSERNNEGRRQVLAPALERKLAESVPKDSLGLLAVISVGLYPEPSWNYVFWDSSPDAPVMVGSLQELGNPAASPAAFRLALARTIKIELQQLLSLLSMHRCLAYECMNNPSEGLDDLDRQPLHLCAATLQQLCWNVSCDPARTLGAAAAFLRENGLDAGWYDRAIPLVSQP